MPRGGGNCPPPMFYFLFIYFLFVSSAVSPVDACHDRCAAPEGRGGGGGGALTFIRPQNVWVDFPGHGVGAVPIGGFRGGGGG